MKKSFYFIFVPIIISVAIGVDYLLGLLWTGNVDEYRIVAVGINLFLAFYLFFVYRKMRKKFRPYTMIKKIFLCVMLSFVVQGLCVLLLLILLGILGMYMIVLKLNVVLGIAISLFIAYRWMLCHDKTLMKQGE